jgi:predicted DNA-binding transcriptional regulator YafY
MMASRLLSILLLLQARGRMSATALAAHCEVSVRTIYRDIDQLSAAGIPIIGDRGRTGGFELTDGFRTKLTGLTQSEAEALFFSSLPGPAADLGLSDLLVTAQLKLLAALPAGMQVERVAARFHLDTTAWFHTAEKVGHLLATIARGVWDDRKIRMRYGRKKEAHLREVDPLGLVLKSGTWYLVARASDAILTYRVSNIVEAEVLGQRFERPSEFDLSGHWMQATYDYEVGLYRLTATVRLSPRGWSLLHLFSPYVVENAAKTASAPDEAGWVRCDLPLESIDYGMRELLRLGADVEVLAPPELCEALMGAARSIAYIYQEQGIPP